MGSDRRQARADRDGPVGVHRAYRHLSSAARRPARPLAWWSPVALRGAAITRVSAIGDTIMVRTATGATLSSTDGGRTFATAAGHCVVSRRLNVVTIGNAALGDRSAPGACCTWLIRRQSAIAARSGLPRSRRGRGPDRGTGRAPRRRGRGEHGRNRLAPRSGRRLEAGAPPAPGEPGAGRPADHLGDCVHRSRSATPSISAPTATRC